MPTGSTLGGLPPGGDSPVIAVGEVFMVFGSAAWPMALQRLVLEAPRVSMQSGL